MKTDKITQNTQLYNIAFSLIPGISKKTSKMLLSHFGSAYNVLHTPKSKLLRIKGIGQKTLEGISKPTLLEHASKVLEATKKYQINPIFYTDNSYPESLKQIYDAPLLLYTKGNIHFSKKRMIAIVGTRNATDYGKKFLDSFIPQLKKYDVTIISGLAYGIDIYAHQLALKHAIPTIAVMANGLDRVYPQMHRSTALDMLTQGGWVSENPPGTLPEAYHFPARNRIIAGLAEAVVVIEAATKGGAMITANLANTYNREVLALPGCINLPYSQGCNQLIKTNLAHLLSDPTDIEYILNWESKKKNISNELLEKRTTEEKIIISALQNTDLMLDDLNINTQIPLNKLAKYLLELEIEGIIKSLPGKKYSLCF